MISIILPVYNCIDYLHRCIDSILAQTEQSWELLLIDDGSTDGSGQLCDLYAQLDRRIKVYHQNNQGVSAARNHGLDMSNGEYVCFVDSDDWLDPMYLNVLLREAEKEKADIVQCGFQEVWGEEIRQGKAVKSRVFCQNREAVKILLEDKESTYAVWNKLFAKRVVSKLRFNTELALHEDACFCLEAYGTSERNVFVPDLIYFYYQRPGSAAHSEFSRKTMGTVYGTRYMLDYTKNNYPEFVQLAERYHLMYVLVGIQRIHQERKEKEYSKYLRELKGILREHLMRALLNPYLSMKAKVAAVAFAI